ncbi:MAG: hypothetical protein HY553_15200 [Elusimicrobia bacterium]|nr:hypothetical protein [Elusimicrobiota bacterium]
MIRFRGPSDAPHSGAWTYLGAGVSERRELEALYGSAPLPLGGALHREAERLRGPFLDLVAELGRDQEPEAWWAGTLSWKSWAASDLFWGCCQLAAGERLAAEPKPLGAAELTVVVEDPWVLRALGPAVAGRPRVDVAPPSGLVRRRVAALALGALRRLYWALRIAASRLAHLVLPRPAPPAASAVLLYSYVTPRAVAVDHGWADAYLPGLEEELEAGGAAVYRTADPDVSGYETTLCRKPRFLPLVAYGTLLGFVRALLARPPEPPDSVRLAGLDIGPLLEREWWHDVSRKGRCAHLFFLDAARSLLKAAPWRAVVLPWEAQPQEKFLVLAAREAGVRSVGYAHSTVPPLLLSWFLGAREAEGCPLPDVVLTAGEHPRALLAAGGLPGARLANGGSRRFSAGGPKPLGPPGKDVLVLLPENARYAEALLDAVARAYPSGGEGFSIVVKPHPAEPQLAERLPFPARAADGALEELLGSAACVVFAASTAGLEALSRGRAAVRFRPDALVDVHPCDLLGPDALPVAGEADLREKVERARTSPPPDPATYSGALERLFAPVDRPLWLKTILSK